MKKILLCLLLIYSVINVNAQLKLTVLGALPTAPRTHLVAILDVSYDINNINIGIGASSYVFLQDVKLPNFIYIKTGYNVKYFNRSYLTVHTGFAIKYYDREVWKGTDSRYSHYETVKIGQPLLSLTYTSKAFYRSYMVYQISQIGKITFISFGVLYKFE